MQDSSHKNTRADGPGIFGGKVNSKNLEILRNLCNYRPGDHRRRTPSCGDVQAQQPPRQGSRIPSQFRVFGLLEDTDQRPSPKRGQPGFHIQSAILGLTQTINIGWKRPIRRSMPAASRHCNYGNLPNLFAASGKHQGIRH
jgi:hypothetical protein